MRAPVPAIPAVRATPPAPLLRGWLHLVCFAVSVPAGLAVVASARPGPTRVGAAVYALAVTGLFAASAGYHRGRWSPVARARMRRVDHAAIFVMIAGTYTPLCLVAFSGPVESGLLAGVWAVAAGGVILAAAGFPGRRRLGMVLYLAFGWGGVVTLPALAVRVSPRPLALLVAGGLVYSVGGAVLASRWPDPWPRVFGYHEVWHVLVVAAATCHFVAVAAVVGSRG